MTTTGLLVRPVDRVITVLLVLILAAMAPILLVSWLCAKWVHKVFGGEK